MLGEMRLYRDCSSVLFCFSPSRLESGSGYFNLEAKFQKDDGVYRVQGVYTGGLGHHLAALISTYLSGRCTRGRLFLFCSLMFPHPLFVHYIQM